MPNERLSNGSPKLPDALPDTLENRKKASQEIRETVEKYFKIYIANLNGRPKYDDFMRRGYGNQERIMQEIYSFLKVGDIAYREYCKLAHAYTSSSASDED
jgi:hypothetical protein